MIDRAEIETGLAQGHNGRLGIRYMSHGAGWAEVAIDPDACFASGRNAALWTSGPIASLMDVATSCAVWAIKGSISHQATLDLRIDYVRPANLELPVFGRGECYHIAGDVAFVRGSAHQGDIANPVAAVAGTFMLLDAVAS